MYILFQLCNSRRKPWEELKYNAMALPFQQMTTYVISLMTNLIFNSLLKVNGGAVEIPFSQQGWLPYSSLY